MAAKLLAHVQIQCGTALARVLKTALQQGVRCCIGQSVVDCQPPRQRETERAARGERERDEEASSVRENAKSKNKNKKKKRRID